VIYARRRRATPQAPEQQPKRPLENLSDADLQQRALSVAADREATITEALFRTRDALLVSQRTADALTGRIWWLNFWLLVFTIVIGFLTTAQVYVAFKSLNRPASAERAWVLWVRTQLPGQATATSVLSVYQTKDACMKAEAEEVAGDSAQLLDAKREVKGETVWIWREENKAGTLERMDYYCLPDTIDPRGPKGAPR